jgi:chromosome segregation ATPase
MRKIAVAVMLFGTSAGLCQTTAKEPDALQALLAEVHQLRQDIEAVTVASQRVQIALYSLQMQDAAVARATARLDAVRSKCSAVAAERDHFVSEAQRQESAIAGGTLPTNELADFRALLSHAKSVAEAKNAEVQSRQASEADASSQLRNDQAKLADLQDRIERLDKTLEKLGVAEK